MNLSERYMFGIYELSVIIRESLEYFTNPPKEGFSVDKYLVRRNIFEKMMGEGTPFANFCKNNEHLPVKDGKEGETIGSRIREQVTNFFNDVYSENANIITYNKENNQIRVEESLFLNLMDYIVGLHETFSDILNGFRESLKNTNDIEPDFHKMLDLDDRYYRALVYRVLAMLINTKFTQFNEAVSAFYKSNPSIDPASGKAFEDPSVKFISKELSKVFGFCAFVKQHSSQKDEEFVACETKQLEALKVFTGETKLADFTFNDGTKAANIREFFAKFVMIFSNIITVAHDEYTKVFKDVYEALIAFEKEMQEKKA